MGGESWKFGGGSAWVTGAMIPRSNTLYWGTGESGPRLGRRLAPRGQPLYELTLALDPDTGKIKFHFQYTPHDMWDLRRRKRAGVDDGTRQESVDPRRCNGYFYAIDRTNGSSYMANRLPW